eukprot:Skav207736  [mRNA]  locus=scaffold362:341111:342103:- [translate_table: standard]
MGRRFDDIWFFTCSAAKIVGEGGAAPDREAACFVSHQAEHRCLETLHKFQAFFLELEKEKIFEAALQDPWKPLGLIKAASYYHCLFKIVIEERDDDVQDDAGPPEELPTRLMPAIQSLALWFKQEGAALLPFYF